MAVTIVSWVFVNYICQWRNVLRSDNHLDGRKPQVLPAVMQILKYFIPQLLAGLSAQHCGGRCGGRKSILREQAHFTLLLERQYVCLRTSDTFSCQMEWFT